VRPTLIVNPASDEVFSKYAETLLDHGAVSTGELERRLQAMYPNAAVHAREIAQEPLVIWYVYREGRWIAPAAAERQGEPDGERQG
jgi:hypothetical protein